MIALISVVIYQLISMIVDALMTMIVDALMIGRMTYSRWRRCLGGCCGGFVVIETSIRALVGVGLVI